MERKPSPSFDRFSEKPRRFSEDRFSDRGDRGDRFGGERRQRFGGDDRFSDRSERRLDRADRGDRFGGERREGGFGRFGGERREGGFGGRRFGGDRPAFKRFDRNEPRFGDRSGPRAKAMETRRFTDRQAFVQTQTVRLDADVAQYFSDPAAVNAALRQVIALAGLVKKAEEEKKAAQAAALALAEAAAPAEDGEEDTDNGSDMGETCAPELDEAEDEKKPEA